MNREKIFRNRCRLLTLAAGMLLAAGSTLTSCSQYDLDEKTPDGWGSSIYGWLDEQGNFTNTVKLIDDLGYHDVLAKTGSKTLFVADDAAYDRFFANNTWGVKKYGDLTLSQKKLLLFGSMMDNSMQLNSLPSVQGNPPREGECLRRYASSSPYDTVAVLTADQMPDNPYWKRYRESGKPMVCMTDNSKTTLLQFIEKLLVNRRITNSDYDFLFNNTTNRKAGDASINGVQVSNPNIKCSNGFIHQMAEVITPLPNMAEVIKSKPQVSQFNRLMERFCAPYPDMNPDRAGSMTMQYNYLYENRQTDTVFQKRFFAEKSQNGNKVTVAPYNGKISAWLKFDPEWNEYYAGLDDQAGNVALQRDMAVIMVPSDEAMNEYWQNGTGRILKDQYGSWDNVPDEVVAELINNNMLSSFIISIPSKFNSILNNANDPMGVKTEDIDSVFLGCNGAIYMTNKVYSPTSFVSVLFPALTNETLKILYWGAKQLQYDVYLNSLNARYSLFIPSNGAMLEYIDPCSYGKTRTQLFRFHWDPTKTNEDERVWASIWNYDVETGEVLDSIKKATNEQIKNRLKDILENHIVIGDVEDGHEYYRTKGGTEIRVANVSSGANGMTVAGSYQLNEGSPLVISRIYNQTQDGNGKSYILEGEPLMSTRKTVFDVLSEHEEFSKFKELLEGSGLLEQTHNNQFGTAGLNISAFNTYHYTIYVPTNESIQALQDAGELSSWEKIGDLEEAGNMEAVAEDSLQIVNFLKYHIQDKALFIGAESEEDGYETALIDPDTERFYRVDATLTDGGLTVYDNAGNTRKVVTTGNLYNLMAREYQYKEKSAASANNLETSSSAVIHLIDKPLFYKKN